MNSCPDILRALAHGVENPARAVELMTLAESRPRRWGIEPAVTEAGAVINAWACRSDAGRFELVLDGEIIVMPPSIESLEQSDAVHLIVKESLGGRSEIVLALIEVLSRKAATSHVEGCACSGAALLAACVPGRRTMARNASLILHGPATLAFGDAAELRRRIESLNETQERMVEALVARTGQPRLTVEHWLRPGMNVKFCAAAAVAHGLCDEVTA